MLRNLSIFNKVFVSHLAIGIVSVMSVSIIFFLLFQHALIERTSDQLSSINILKKNHIEEYFRNFRKSAEYNFKHERTEPWFQKDPDSSKMTDDLDNLQHRYDAKSIFILDAHFKTIGYSTHDTLAERLATALNDDIIHDDFQVIDASSVLPLNHTEMFYLFSVKHDSTLLGFICVHDNFERIQTILQETAGMGTTGESYLIGEDRRLRSPSRFLPDASPQSLVVSEEATRDSGAGDIMKDYRGVNVLSYHRKIATPFLNWAIVSEIDYSEAMKPVIQWRNLIIGAAVFVMMVILAVTYFIANSIAGPILYLKEIIATLSKGIIPKEPIKTSESGEIGEIARAVSELIAGLKRTTQFADETGAGNFDATFTTLGPDDTLGMALLRMQGRLRELTDQQVRLIRDKTSALLEGQEHERKRIVQELHDGVGQLLTAIRLQVEMLEKNEKSSVEIRSLVNETIGEVRRISYNLMPNSIVDFGLEAALQGLCDDIRKVSTFTIDFTYVREFQHEISFEISIAVYRIIQEGFNNILKHSEATHVDLNVLDNEHQIYLLLRDNGKGFLPTVSAGFGLRIMEERAKLLNGTLDVHAVVGIGTELEGTIPLVPKKMI